jgi:hypothetical protein
MRRRFPVTAGLTVALLAALTAPAGASTTRTRTATYTGGGAVTGEPVNVFGGIGGITVPSESFGGTITAAFTTPTP